MLTHGGMGYAKEYHVERYMREVMITRDRPGQPADDPELHRRARAGAAQILLKWRVTLRPSAFVRARSVSGALREFLLGEECVEGPGAGFG